MYLRPEHNLLCVPVEMGSPAVACLGQLSGARGGDGEVPESARAAPSWGPPIGPAGMAPLWVAPAGGAGK